MKHYYLSVLMALACVFTLPGCDTTNGNDDPFVICPGPGDSPFDKTYTMDGDGCCILENADKYTEEEIRKEVVGYGWKVVGTYEVQKDGRLSRQDYWKDMIGGGPTDYWFETEKQMVCFYRNYDTTQKYNKKEWSYDANRGFVWRDSKYSNQTPDEKYMQVINIYTHDSNAYMYTMQRIAVQATEGNKLTPVFAMVVYQRMTDSELKKMKTDAQYDADKDNNEAVPNSCKFRVKASYWNPDDGETSGAVIAAFRKVEFTLTDNLGTTIGQNPALQYFDSIVWKSNSNSLPGKYRIYKKGESLTQSTIKWSSYFLDKTPDLVSFFCGYKDGRIAYTYEMHHDIYTDSFLCYDWSTFSINKPREYTASNLLSLRSFTVYEPRTLGDDMNKVYAQLRYNSEEKGHGNSIYILEQEADNLSALMSNHYTTGTNVGKQADTYRKKFHALPEMADIKMYWETADTRIALILNNDELDAQNCYYYIHAEPK